MKLTKSSALNFQAPRRVTSPIVDEDRAWPLIQRTYQAYQKLIEVAHGIMTLSPVEAGKEEGQTIYYFDIWKGPYYTAFHECIGNVLTWCTDINGPDYAASLADWKNLLREQSVDDATLSLIAQNDLTDPRFEDFKTTLTLFKVSASATPTGFWRRNPNFEID